MKKSNVTTYTSDGEKAYSIEVHTREDWNAINLCLSEYERDKYMFNEEDFKELCKLIDEFRSEYKFGGSE